MPEMDEGAFVLDYLMPVGTSLVETDTVLRRVEAVLARHARRRRLHPPHGRRELGFFATEPFRGDILVSLKPSGRAPTARTQILEDLRERARRTRCRELTDRVRAAGRKTRSTTCPASTTPDRGQGLRSRPGGAPRRWPSRWATSSKQAGAKDVNSHVDLGNPDIVVRPDSVQAARVGLTADGRREPAQRGALRPGGQHAARAGPHDEHSRPLSRTRVRFDRERLGRLPIALPAAAAAGHAAPVRRGRAGLRAAGPDWPRSNASAAPTSCGARTSSR